MLGRPAQGGSFGPGRPTARSIERQTKQSRERAPTDRSTDRPTGRFERARLRTRAVDRSVGLVDRRVDFRVARQTPGQTPRPISNAQGVRDIFSRHAVQPRTPRGRLEQVLCVLEDLSLSPTVLHLQTRPSIGSIDEEHSTPSAAKSIDSHVDRCLTFDRCATFVAGRAPSPPRSSPRAPPHNQTPGLRLRVFLHVSSSARLTDCCATLATFAGREERVDRPICVKEIDRPNRPIDRSTRSLSLTRRACREGAPAPPPSCRRGG